MPERVKKLEGQFDNVLCDLEKISGSLVRLEKMGCDLGRVAGILGKLVNSEGTQDVAKGSVDGGNSYVS
jgi:hypothetical protein